MAIVTVYRNGATSGMAGRNPSPAKRDVIKGWTMGAVRRHTKWLYSVDAPRLDGVGLALTLTMRDTPATSDDFKRVREAMLQRVRRAGATRFHWVVEWQRRGTPHLHMAIYLPEGTDVEHVAALLIFGWVDTAREYRAGMRAQYYDTIDGPLGWLQYLSKHASRGVRHYQRNGHPDGWATTGRLWGHSGEWPTDEPMRFDLSPEAYHRFRRLVRAWRVADARAGLPAAERRYARSPRQEKDLHALKSARRRITYARRMLASGDRKLSSVRGVSDWLPEDVALQLVALLESDGHEVVQRVE